nr:MAG TPA: hypothetical protein [Caudoviricetes sp.]
MTSYLVRINTNLTNLFFLFLAAISGLEQFFYFFWCSFNCNFHTNHPFYKKRAAD